ncbi:DUF1775 domain-containing protein [Egicoccus sp. AB-alg6-2]|uniref:DUF1775 domain-containing protein n=1 Tax=Egicoccus sp. AB-alg6-2 TaxID=3242692 RepID=UPI00359E08D1
MRRLTLTTSTTFALLMLWAGPAAAHAGLMPGDLVPGTASDSEVVIVHGCGPGGTIPANDDETYPTTSVTLSPPDGLTVVPREVEGWTLTTETDSAGEVQHARWQFDDPAGTLEAIFLGVEVTPDADLDGATLWVPVTQECTDGERLDWIAETAHESHGQLPAMLVNVSSAVLAASEVPSTGLSTGVIITLALALGIVAGGGVAIVSARRG